MPEFEPLELFGIPVEVDTTIDLDALELREDGRVHMKVRLKTPPREVFLTGLLAQWAASDREPGAKPTVEERRRAAEGAKAALGEIAR